MKDAFDQLINKLDMAEEIVSLKRCQQKRPKLKNIEKRKEKTEQIIQEL